MSKIGNRPITLPAGVTVTVTNGIVSVQGPKGQLNQPLVVGTSLTVENQEIVVSPQNKTRSKRAAHGLMRSLVQNMVTGVSEGFTKRLKLIGTGYRVQQQGRGLSLTVGYSHPVIIAPVEGITFSLEGNDTIIITGHDKQLVGQVAADIRKQRPPEPYKGKGIRYENEHIIRKQGKTLGK